MVADNEIDITSTRALIIGAPHLRGTVRSAPVDHRQAGRQRRQCGFRVPKPSSSTPKAQWSAIRPTWRPSPLPSPRRPRPRDGRRTRRVTRRRLHLGRTGGVRSARRFRGRQVKLSAGSTVGSSHDTRPARHRTAASGVHLRTATSGDDRRNHVTKERSRLNNMF